MYLQIYSFFGGCVTKSPQIPDSIVHEHPCLGMKNVKLSSLFTFHQIRMSSFTMGDSYFLNAFQLNSKLYLLVKSHQIKWSCFLRSNQFCWPSNWQQWRETTSFLLELISWLKPLYNNGKYLLASDANTWSWLLLQTVVQPVVRFAISQQVSWGWNPFFYYYFFPSIYEQKLSSRKSSSTSRYFYSRKRKKLFESE